MLSGLLYQWKPVVIGVETFHVWTQWGLKDCRPQQNLADAQVNTYYSKSSSQCGAHTLPASDGVAFKKLWPFFSALWWHIWWFNHTVIVCLVRFSFCVIGGKNEKDGPWRRELFYCDITLNKLYLYWQRLDWQGVWCKFASCSGCQARTKAIKY